MNTDQIYSVIRGMAKAFGPLLAAEGIGDVAGWGTAADATCAIIGAGLTLWGFVASWHWHKPAATAA